MGVVEDGDSHAKCDCSACNLQHNAGVRDLSQSDSLSSLMEIFLLKINYGTGQTPPEYFASEPHALHDLILLLKILENVVYQVSLCTKLIHKTLRDCFGFQFQFYGVER